MTVLRPNACNVTTVIKVVPRLQHNLAFERRAKYNTEQGHRNQQYGKPRTCNAGDNYNIAILLLSHGGCKHACHAHGARQVQVKQLVRLIGIACTAPWCVSDNTH